MEFFEKSSEAIRLKTHHNKYLIAGDDYITVRQSQSAVETRRARWLIEHVDSNNHVIRLKSCYGKYLTASDTPFLLGMTGKKVIQSLPENVKDLAIEWQPVRDGFQVKLKTSGGTYLRANGAMPPWRNSVTHDGSSSSRDNCMLFDVEVVKIPEDEEFSDYLRMVTSFSAVSDEISGLEYGSPVSIHSSSFSPRTPVLSMKKKILSSSGYIYLSTIIIHTYIFNIVTKPSSILTKTNF
ncbi:hypothetical protein QVD17_31472 [Tagetes erecta]|uniref:DUF569 domain-containing protein n=1 Tax=Tagetes erecta TaxID=13708 RepID=A0AAD8K3U9_TARER|nr:hypothetical protein QVD17_31472 [Tagetes erecta]